MMALQRRNPKRGLAMKPRSFPKYSLEILTAIGSLEKVQERKTSRKQNSMKRKNLAKSWRRLHLGTELETFSALSKKKKSIGKLKNFREETEIVAGFKRLGD